MTSEYWAVVRDGTTGQLEWESLYRARYAAEAVRITLEKLPDCPPVSVKRIRIEVMEE